MAGWCVRIAGPGVLVVQLGIELVSFCPLGGFYFHSQHVALRPAVGGTRIIGFGVIKWGSVVWVQVLVPLPAFWGAVLVNGTD